MTGLTRVRPDADLDEVVDILERDGGVIVEQGPAKALLNQPQHPRTQDFLRRVLHPL